MARVGGAARRRRERSEPRKRLQWATENAISTLTVLALSCSVARAPARFDPEISSAAAAQILASRADAIIQHGA